VLKFFILFFFFFFFFLSIDLDPHRIPSLKKKSNQTLQAQHAARAGQQRAHVRSGRRPLRDGRAVLLGGGSGGRGGDGGRRRGGHGLLGGGELGGTRGEVRGDRVGVVAGERGLHLRLGLGLFGLHILVEGGLQGGDGRSVGSGGRSSGGVSGGGVGVVRGGGLQRLLELGGLLLGLGLGGGEDLGESGEGRKKRKKER